MHTAAEFGAWRRGGGPGAPTHRVPIFCPPHTGWDMATRGRTSAAVRGDRETTDRETSTRGGPARRLIVTVTARGLLLCRRPCLAYSPILIGVPSRPAPPSARALHASCGILAARPTGRAGKYLPLPPPPCLTASPCVAGRVDILRRLLAAPAANISARNRCASTASTSSTTTTPLTREGGEGWGGGSEKGEGGGGAGGLSVWGFPSRARGLLRSRAITMPVPQ